MSAVAYGVIPHGSAWIAWIQMDGIRRHKSFAEERAAYAWIDALRGRG